MSFHILHFDFILSNVHLSSSCNTLICKLETCNEGNNLSRRSKANNKALLNYHQIIQIITICLK